MNKIKQTVGVLAAGLAVSLLTACGSGGTSKSSANQYAPAPLPLAPLPAPTQAIELNLENYSDVASVSLRSLLLSEAGVSALDRAVSVTRSNSPAVTDMVTGIVLNLSPLPCQQGGNFTLAAEFNNSNNNLQINFNDSLSMAFHTQFNQCDVGFSRLHGDVSLTMDANLTQLINGFGFAFNSALTVNQLLVQQQNMPEFTFGGNFSYKFENHDGINVQTEIVSSNTLYYADSQYRMMDFSVNKLVNNQTREYAYYVTSEFADSRNPDFYIAYQTLSPLTGAGFSFPSGGTLAVSGSNAIVYIHAMENEQLHLQLDMNGDGIINDEYFTNWHDLVISAFGQ